MPLISLWQSNPAAVSQFTIDQIVSAAGDGSLRDGSECSAELRKYLSETSSETLAAYVDQCLSQRQDKNGLVLQDLVNELGRRLDYGVTNGRYRGVPSSIGFDGIWVAPEGHSMIVEVKTTDAYRISLDTIVGYRNKLLSAGEVTDRCSILVVVGRQDTGELEAQVRGSRHAWDIRLISAEALIKLVKLKESSGEVETGAKIRSVLMPVEYTRLDGLVDVMFTTASDVDPPSDEAIPGEVDGEGPLHPDQDSQITANKTLDREYLQRKRESAIAALSKEVGVALIRKTRALYWSSDHQVRVACTISKRYTNKSHSAYWYAYHPAWDVFLSEGAKGYFVLSCMDLQTVFAIPRSEMIDLIDHLYVSETPRGKYWHIHLREVDGSYELEVPRGQNNLILDKFALKMAG